MPGSIREQKQYQPKNLPAFNEAFAQAQKNKRAPITSQLNNVNFRDTFGGWDDETETQSTVGTFKIDWNQEKDYINNNIKIDFAKIRFISLLNAINNLQKIENSAIDNLCRNTLLLMREFIDELKIMEVTQEDNLQIVSRANEILKEFINDIFHKIQFIRILKLKELAKTKDSSLQLTILFEKATALNEKIFDYPMIAEVCTATLNLADALIKNTPEINKNEKPEQQLAEIKELNKTAKKTVNYLENIILSPLDKKTSLTQEEAEQLTEDYIAAHTKASLCKVICDITSAVASIALGFCIGCIAGGIIGLTTGVVHSPLIALGCGLAGAGIATAYHAKKLAGRYGLFPVESSYLLKITTLAEKSEEFAEQHCVKR